MHVFVGFSALAFCTIFAFSLADIFLDDDIVPAESLSPESNLGFNNNDVKDVGDSTLTFNDFVYPADSDIDFMASSAACGGGNGNLNKLRLRQNGATSCDTQEKGGAIVPEVFQSNEPILDRLGALSKTGGRRCIWRPYITNCCCNGIVGLIYSMGPPMVHVDIPDCYVSMTNLFFFLSFFTFLLHSSLRFG